MDLIKSSATVISLDEAPMRDSKGSPEEVTKYPGQWDFKFQKFKKLMWQKVLAKYVNFSKENHLITYSVGRVKESQRQNLQKKKNFLPTKLLIPPKNQTWWWRLYFGRVWSNNQNLQFYKMFEEQDALLTPRGEPRLELGVHVFEIMWNSLDNAPSSIVFYLEMKVEVGVHEIRSRFAPRLYT